MRVELSQHTVTIKDSLSWGEMQKVQAVVASGAKLSAAGLQGFDTSAMLEAKYVLLETAVVRVVSTTPGNEGDVTFTRDWMNDLSQEDGDKLYEAVNELTKKNRDQQPSS